MAGGVQAAIYYEDTGGDGLNATSASPLDWDTVEREDTDTFTHSGSPFTDVTLDVGGLYLVGGGLGVEGDSPGTRAAIDTAIVISGAFEPHQVARSFAYMRNTQSANEAHACGCNLVYVNAANDTMTMFYRRLDTDSGTWQRSASPNAGGMWAVKFDDDFPHLILNIADVSGTAHILGTSFSPVEWSKLEHDGGGIGYGSLGGGNSEDEFTLEEAGHYLICCELEFENPESSRRTPEMRLYSVTDSAAVQGTRVARVIRGASGIDTTWLTFFKIIETTEDDVVVRVEARKTGGSGDVAHTANGRLGICKLRDESVLGAYCRLRDSGIGQRADTNAVLDFDTVDEEDTATFDHDPSGAGQELVEVLDGDGTLYFGCHTAKSERLATAAQRISHRVSMDLDGTIVNWGHSSAYNRGATNALAAGTSGALIFEANETQRVNLDTTNRASGSDSSCRYLSANQSFDLVSLAQLLPLCEELSETVEVEEEVDRVLGLAKQVSEDVEVEEEVLRALVLARAVDEDVEVAEEVLSALSLRRARDEDVEVEEEVERLTTLLRAVTEDEEVLEEVVRALEIARARDEAEEIVENAVRAITFAHEVGEDLELSEEVLAQLGFVAAVDELVELEETVHGVTLRRRAGHRGSNALAGSEVGSNASPGAERGAQELPGSEQGWTGEAGSERGTDPRGG